MDKLLLLSGVLCVSCVTAQSTLPEIPILSVASGGNIVKGRSRVDMKCEGSSPDAAVRWFLDGDEIVSADPRGFLISHSRLEIPSYRHSKNAAESHSGQYRCMVDKLLSNQVTLSKARIRQFDSNLKDIAVEVVAGNTAVIPCEPPASRPVALTVFEINGTTIDESHARHFLMNNGDLQIKSVTRGDSGVYRCVAINSITNDKVPSPNTVTLRVIDATTQSEPVLLEMTAETEGRRVSGMEGDNIMLPCVMRGYPVPTIRWDRYGNNLPADRTILVNDNLVIESIQEGDGGTYQCLGENAASDNPLSLIYILDVLMKPKIDTTAFDAEKYAEVGASVTFACPVQRNLHPFATTLWYYNGVKVTAEAPDVLLSEDGSLTLQTVKSEHDGNYQCFVTNAVGEDLNFIRLNVFNRTTTSTTTTTTTTSTTTTATTTEAPLVAPSAPEVTQVRLTGVKLEWQIASDERVLSYQIRMRQGRETWEVIASAIPRQARFTEINTLQPGHRYRFQVVAIYRGGRSEVSDSSARIKLDPEFANQEEIYKPAMTSTTNPNPIITEEPITPRCVGICEAPIISTTLRNHTRAVADSLNLLCLSNDPRASITWYRDGHPLVGSDIGYNVENQVLLLNLYSSSLSGWYTCKAANDYGQSEQSSYVYVQEPAVRVTPTTTATTTTTTTVKTTTTTVSPPDPDRMIPPSKPRVRAINPTTVILQWDPNTRGAKVNFYKIQYRTRQERGRAWDTLEGSIRNTTTYKVMALTPGERYKFRIVAVYINGGQEAGEVSDRVTMPETLDPLLPNDPPSMVPRITMARQTASNTLQVRWVYYGLDSESFTVQYQDADLSQTNWKEVTVTTDGEDMWEVFLRRLPANITYAVRVIPVNQYGRGKPSNTVSRNVTDPFNQYSGWFKYETTPSTPKANVKIANGVDEALLDTPKINKEGNLSDSDMLYIILGAVLGALILLLMIFVAICGFKQRQQSQRRAMLGKSPAQNKFADPSKVIYGEHTKQETMPKQFALHQALANGTAHHGTMSSVSSSKRGMEPYTRGMSPRHDQQMSLNINPMNELDNPYEQNADPYQEEYSGEKNDTIDYNLMQHYPHFNNSNNRPSAPYHHNSQHSIGDRRQPYDGDPHFSHNSLPHHYAANSRAMSPPQFSTFLPRVTQDGETKLPHPQGLRPVHSMRPQSPVSSLSDAPQKRRRKKRSTPSRDYQMSHDSAKEAVSSDEASGMDDGMFSKGLPPPPHVPHTYATSPEETTPLQDGITD